MGFRKKIRKIQKNSEKFSEDVVGLIFLYVCPAGDIFIWGRFRGDLEEEKFRKKFKKIKKIQKNFQRMWWASYSYMFALLVTFSFGGDLEEIWRRKNSEKNSEFFSEDVVGLI